MAKGSRWTMASIAARGFHASPERPDAARSVFRRERLGDLVTAALECYRQDWWLFVRILAVVYIPAQMLYGLAAGYPPDWKTPAARLVNIALLFAFLPAQGAAIKAMVDRILDRPASPAGSDRYFLQRLVPYMLTGLLQGLLIGIGLILLVVPGIIASFWLFLVPYVMIVEDRYYGQAFERSRQLAAGRWGRLFVVGVLSCLPTMATYRPLLALFTRLAIPSQGASLVLGLLDGVGQSLLAPIALSLGLLLYLDARVRRERLDPAQLARETARR